MLTEGGKGMILGEPFAPVLGKPHGLAPSISMETDEYLEDHDDVPNYRTPDEVQASELSQAVRTLYFFEDDPYLRIQASNLAIIDHFIMKLEWASMRKRFDEENEDVLDTAFISAQTQMWIFAAYELLRTWRQRAKDAVKLSKVGGLAMKADALDKKLPYAHHGRKVRAEQLRRIIANPSLLDRIALDIRRTHILFSQLEHVRVAIAKHEVSGKPKSVAYAPGFGTFDRWNGSLEYEIGFEGAIMGMLSRRDIAESLRYLSQPSEPPSDEDLADFDAMMKGPPADLFND